MRPEGRFCIFNRAYETTMAEVTQVDRAWRNDYVASPTAWGKIGAGCTDSFSTRNRQAITRSRFFAAFEIQIRCLFWMVCSSPIF